MRIRLHTIPYSPNDAPEEDLGRASGVKSSERNKEHKSMNILMT